MDKGTKDFLQFVGGICLIVFALMVTVGAGMKVLDWMGVGYHDSSVHISPH